MKARAEGASGEHAEQYLLHQADDWKKYYANVATLPLDEKSAFIRAVFNFGSQFQQRPGMRSVSVLSPVQELLKGVADGKVQLYLDVVNLSR